VAEAQIYPFFKHRAELEEKLRFVFDEIRISNPKEIRTDLCVRHSNIVFIQDRCFGGVKSEERIDFLREFTGRARLVWLDSWDSTYANASGFSVLPYVDLYIKKQIFRDLSLYKNQYLDGRIFSDYLIREGNLKRTFTGSVIGSKQHWHKVVVGWNIGSEERLDKEFSKQNYRAFQTDQRPIDIHCSVATSNHPFREWHSYHRNLGLSELNRMASGLRVIARSSKISWDDYWSELRNSKITVGPFGWGEICPRDFDAVICGSLLIKPSVEHLDTLPDIFVSGKTYVPVKWDFSDLKEKCDYFIRNHAERNSIVKNAERQYAKYFQEKVFVRKIGEILDRLELN
jgi:RNAse (barnase) inhibitor barstar